MDEKEMIAALQGMLANNVEPGQAISLIQQAVSPNVSEAALIEDLKTQHPGLSESEYRVLFNQKFPSPQEDDEDAATKETLRKAAIAQALAEKKAAIAQDAREKLKGYLPDPTAPTRRAEQVKAWQTTVKEFVKDGKIDIEEGLSLGLPKDATFEAFINQVAETAVQQGLEPGAVTDDLKDQMIRLALAFEGAAGFKAAIKSATAKVREDLLKEFSSGRPMGGSPTPPPAKNLPKPGGGFV